MKNKKKELSTLDYEALLEILKNRFEKNMELHSSLSWLTKSLVDTGP